MVVEECMYLANSRYLPDYPPIWLSTPSLPSPLLAPPFSLDDKHILLTSLTLVFLKQQHADHAVSMYTV